MKNLAGEDVTPLAQQAFQLALTNHWTAREAEEAREATVGLELLNVARAAIADLTTEVEPWSGIEARPRARVSAPGEGEPGEFYVEIERMNFVVKVEAL